MFLRIRGVLVIIECGEKNQNVSLLVCWGLVYGCLLVVCGHLLVVCGSLWLIAGGLWLLLTGGL